MPSAPDRRTAQAVIAKLGSTGTPPEIGIEAFTVGLEKYLGTIEREYLEGILTYGLSSFKLVTGSYGVGKTHFLYSVRNLAFRHNYCVAYVSLSPSECPFDKLELVYKAIATNIAAPATAAAEGGSGSTAEDSAVFKRTGIEAMLRQWFADRKRQVDRTEGLDRYLASLPGTESTSFFNALKGAFLSLAAGDAEGFTEVLQWLKGEDVGRDVRARFRISERVDKATAFRMLRSLAQWVHASGYRGTVFLFDEAERGMSISSARDRRRALDNLRQIVDECGNSRLPGTIFFYAVPDENLLLEGSGGVYEALKQRLRSAFSVTNPVGVCIRLEELDMEPLDFLVQLGGRLGDLFETAYDVRLPVERRSGVLRALAESAVSAYALDVSYRRLFVVAAVEGLQQLRQNPALVFGPKEAERLLRNTKRLLDASSAADDFRRQRERADGGGSDGEGSGQAS